MSFIEVIENGQEPYFWSPPGDQKTSTRPRDENISSWLKVCQKGKASYFVNRKTKKTAWHLYGLYHNKRPDKRSSKLVTSALAALRNFLEDPSTQEMLDADAKANHGGDVQVAETNLIHQLTARWLHPETETKHSTPRKSSQSKRRKTATTPDKTAAATPGKSATTPDKTAAATPSKSQGKSAATPDKSPDTTPSKSATTPDKQPGGLHVQTNVESDETPPPGGSGGRPPVAAAAATAGGAGAGGAGANKDDDYRPPIPVRGRGKQKKEPFPKQDRRITRTMRRVSSAPPAASNAKWRRSLTRAGAVVYINEDTKETSAELPGDAVVESADDGELRASLRRGLDTPKRRTSSRSGIRLNESPLLKADATPRPRMSRSDSIEVDPSINPRVCLAGVVTQSIDRQQRAARRKARKLAAKHAVTFGKRRLRREAKYNKMKGAESPRAAKHDWSKAEILKSKKLLWEEVANRDTTEMKGKWILNFRDRLKIELPDTYSGTDYAPKVFRYLRHQAGIADDDYKASMAGITGGAEGEGKSKMLFFRSGDNRYIIKTVKELELENFLQILENYYFHMMSNPDSLLCRFYGLYRLHMPKLKRTYDFVVMENLFNTKIPFPLADHKFDLKGSTKNRFTVLDLMKAGYVGKDLNFESVIQTGPEVKSALIRQMELDVWWLRENNIMDYSLLLGIIPKSALDGYKGDASANAGRWRSFHNGIEAMPGGEDHAIYYMSIIDILQPYNMTKKMETAVKCKAEDKKDYSYSAISAVAPTPYGFRFLRYMHTLME